MHARENARAREAENSRPPASKAATRAATPMSPLLALQCTVGNAATVKMLRRANYPGVQEEHRHGADCDHQWNEHTVQRSTVHDVLRTPGRPLSHGTRVEMEARLGADFSDVRVHSDSAARVSAAEVGARAYTSGTHIVLGADGGGKHTLAHELTHVIQQRSGPVAGSDNGSGLRISHPDDRFERAAEANAQRVMSGNIPTLAEHAPATPVPAQQSQSSDALPIARLISVEHFKEQSSVKRSLRPRVLRDLDGELKQFHRIPDGQFTARSRQLEAIVQLCSKALEQLKDGTRKKTTADLMNKAATEKYGMALDVAIETAMLQARNEQPIYQCMERYQQRQGESGGFVHLMDANDLLASHAASLGDNDLGSLSAAVQNVMSKAVHALTAEQKAYLVRRDLRRIEALRDELPDGALKRILAEVLTGTDQVHFEAGGAGAKLGGPSGQAYTIKHGLTQPDGTVERSGSLVHELTHVATHRMYEHSAVMLMLPLSMSETQAVDLARHRTARIAELETLLGRERAAIPESHMMLITNKLSYAKGNKLLTYVTNFRKRLTDEGNYERLKRLAGLIPEGSSTLVEYDTVLNQLLVMTHMWGMGPDSQFRNRVEALAQERYQHRQAGTAEPAPTATA